MSQKRKTNLITQTQQANIAHNIEVAIKDNDLKKLKLIFEDYPNLLSYESHNEKSWLHLAAREGTVKIVTYLVKKGIDVNVLDKNKHSPLHYACMNDKYENILILCKLGSKVNHKQSEGNTPLHHAAYFNNVNTIQALLQEGADINARNTHGETALHWAAHQNKSEAAKLLVLMGIDKSIQSMNNYETAFMYAKRNGFDEVADVIKKNEKDVGREIKVLMIGNNIVDAKKILREQEARYVEQEKRLQREKFQLALEKKRLSLQKAETNKKEAELKLNERKEVKSKLLNGLKEEQKKLEMSNQLIAMEKVKIKKYDEAITEMKQKLKKFCDSEESEKIKKFNKAYDEIANEISSLERQLKENDLVDASPHVNRKKFRATVSAIRATLSH